MMAENYNRQEQLKYMHNNRKEATRQKVEAAIMRLVKGGCYVNFNSVAKESGVSKATLYNNQEIRQSIESLRSQQSQVSSPAQVKREMGEQTKDAVIASLKRKIQILTDENKALKEQIKINYAKFYEKL